MKMAPIVLLAVFFVSCVRPGAKLKKNSGLGGSRLQPRYVRPWLFSLRTVNSPYRDTTSILAGR
jgi:hypothetical protein